MAAYQSHLLVHLESFAWQDLDTDRTVDLEKYGQAVVSARDHMDEIYLHPDFWTLSLPWGLFSTLLSEQKADWLFPGSKAQRLLCDFLMFSVSQVSPKPARIVDELKKDFEGQNCGLIGCSMPVSPVEEWVFDKSSWLDFHLMFVCKRPELIQWNRHQFLPNLEYSMQFLATEAERVLSDQVISMAEAGQCFYDEVVKRLPKGQGGEGEMIRLSREVARRNFYEEDFDLSSREQQRRGSQRKIFKVKKAEIWQYLSLDFEKCAFEVCDQNGRHQGEFRFDGKENGRNTKDSSGKHDIWVLTK